MLLEERMGMPAKVTLGLVLLGAVGFLVLLLVGWITTWSKETWIGAYWGLGAYCLLYWLAQISKAIKSLEETQRLHALAANEFYKSVERRMNGR